MKTNSLKIASLIAAGIVLGASPALALDGKVVLDQLVKKGVITPEEADAILEKDTAKQKADPKPAIGEAKQKDVTKLTISGRVQVQGKYFERNSVNSTSDAGQTKTAGFELRRLNLDFDAELPKDFNLFGSIEATAGNAGGNPTFIIDKAGVKYSDKDAGIFCAALQKSRFGQEEYTSASEIYTIERSAVSNYFAGSGASATSLGLGGRHIGLYWETKELKAVEKDGGLRLGAAVTNSYQNSFNALTTPANEAYCPAFYANADYGIKIDDATMLTFGANLAYTEANIDQRALTAGANDDSRTTGLELTSKLKTGKLTVMGDFMSAFVENGRANKSAPADTVSALPWGATATVAYRLTEEIEPLVQLGYVDSDGRGITDGTFRDAPLNGNSASPTVGAGGATYDRAYTVFVGSAWYITPKSLKLTAGLDCARFEGRNNTSVLATKQQSDVIGGRIQIQALF